MASGGVKRGRARVTGVYKIKCTAEVEVSRRGIRSAIEDLSERQKALRETVRGEEPPSRNRHSSPISDNEYACIQHARDTHRDTNTQNRGAHAHTNTTEVHTHTYRHTPHTVANTREHTQHTQTQNRPKYKHSNTHTHTCLHADTKYTIHSAEDEDKFPSQVQVQHQGCLSR